MPRPPEIDEAVCRLEQHSLPVAQLTERSLLRRALEALSITLTGSQAAATTARRKRAVLHNALEYAVEQGELSANLLSTVRWQLPRPVDAMDRRVVVNPRQAHELITAMSYIGAVERGRHLITVIAVLYYAGLRPSEAAGLRLIDCVLPDDGWGCLAVSNSRPQTNRRWTTPGMLTTAGDSRRRKQPGYRAAEGCCAGVRTPCSEPKSPDTGTTRAR